MRVGYTNSYVPALLLDSAQVLRIVEQDTVHRGLEDYCLLGPVAPRCQARVSDWDSAEAVVGLRLIRRVRGVERVWSLWSKV
jgi:hypothetical protein